MRVPNRVSSRSIAFAAARVCQEQGAEIVLSNFGRGVSLTEKLAKKSYQDIYIDLSSASMPNTKVFISDLGADGLKARRRENEPFDTA